ncbi:MAG TPA: four helix bundle protein [Clostridia bacterium]|nr:four helix bundle protein [Clostridia bacterium]
MSDFKQLKVWKKAFELTISIYRATEVFPKSELFGLTSQLRRASASVGANIAEGCGRRGDGELVRFLQIATGSNAELEYHLLLAHALGYISQRDHDSLQKKVREIGAMLTSLINASRSSARTSASRDSRLRDSATRSQARTVGNTS